MTDIIVKYLLAAKGDCFLVLYDLLIEVGKYENKLKERMTI